MCDTKIGGPKKIAGNFEKPQRIAQRFACTEKNDLAKFKTPKNRTSISVYILTPAPLRYSLVGSLLFFFLNNLIKIRIN